MSPKDIISKFYNSDLANDADVMNTFFHKDFILDWHSSQGFKKLNYSNFHEVLEDVRISYSSLRFEISHLLQEDNTVMVRYASYATTIENETEEIPLAHFTTIWEVKNDKIIKGFQMSQMADASSDSLNSFSK